MYKFGSENLRSTIEVFLLVWLSNYVSCKFVFLCLDVNVYLFIYFGETFFMFQIQYLFVIKLGSILT
jgi:hypothetical protein